MKHPKMPGLMALLAAAVTVLAGTASATTVTAPSGTAYTGTISISNESSVTFDQGFVDVTCQNSAIEGKVESHGAGVTAKGVLSKLTFTNCNHHVSVLKNGTFEWHGESGGEGTLTSSGAEIQMTVTTIFGNTKCVWGSSNTRFGKVTPASGSTGHARIHADSTLTLVHALSDFACSTTTTWRGTYKINTPTGMHIDS